MPAPNVCASRREFIASLAKQLVIRAYVAHERLPIGYLYILKRGLVVKLWRFLGSGKVALTLSLTLTLTQP